MNLFHPDTSIIISLIISVVLPLLSSLLSKAHWPAEVAGIITLALSTANGFFTEWAQSSSGPGTFDWRDALGLALSSFIIAALGRLVLWRNTEIDAKLLAIGSRRPDEDLPAAA